MSKDLLEPKKWIPNYIFRFYTNNDHKNILAYVSILLDDDIYGDYRYKIMEPLITAGFFDYGVGNNVDDDWEYWYAKWYGYCRENE